MSDSHSGWHRSVIPSASRSSYAQAISPIAQPRARYDDGVTFQAFEAIVVHGRSPSEVAQALGLSLESVYQAKSRVLARLRIQLDAMGDDLDSPDARHDGVIAT
jgi:hypothetical protein